MALLDETCGAVLGVRLRQLVAGYPEDQASVSSLDEFLGVGVSHVCVVGGG